MQKQDLELIFNKAKENGVKYIGVQVWTKGNEKPEIIINETESFDKKLDYYKNAYNDDLVLKSYDGISIRAAAMANRFSEMESLLVNYNMKECREALFGFGEAIKYLKGGIKVARKSWNGKGMWIEYCNGKDHDFSVIEPFLLIKNVKSSFNTWVPSISDLLAEDWMFID